MSNNTGMRWSLEETVAALGEGALYDELERIFAEQNLRVTSRSSELPNHLIDRLADQIARLSGGAETKPATPTPMFLQLFSFFRKKNYKILIKL